MVVLVLLFLPMFSSSVVLLSAPFAAASNASDIAFGPPSGSMSS